MGGLDIKVFSRLFFLCLLVIGIYIWTTSSTDKAIAALVVACGLGFLSTHIL